MKNAKWREASLDTGALTMTPAAMGELAGKAGSKLGSMSSTSRGTAKHVLGTAGEGLRNAGVGAGIGASIGSVIPGIGTVIGGAIGAIGGAVVGVLHYLFGGGLGGHATRKLTAAERNLLNRGIYINKTRHLPGAFQDAVLYVYNPTAYRLLRAQGRLPSEIEAQLLKKNAYAAHAAAIDRQYGARIQRELAHLPPDLRTLVGVSTVTGHSRELYIAIHRALAERALVARKAAARAHALHSSLHRAFAGRIRLALRAAPAFSARPPEGRDPPALREQPWTPGPEIAEESAHDPFRDLPVADAPEQDGDASGALDDLAVALEKSRQSQRRYLRDSWVKDTWVGDFLHLDDPDDRSAPVAPAPSPGSGRPPSITLVPEPDSGAPPGSVEDTLAQILAKPPRFPPTRWDPLQEPVQVYFWDAFASQWRRVGDGNDYAQTKALMPLMLTGFHFPVTYGLLHTNFGTEVIRAVKNTGTERGGGDRLGTWRPIGSGVIRMWSPQYTFYSTTFPPGAPLRFDFGGGAQSDTGDPFHDTAEVDTGDIVDDVYGKGLALVRLRPFLRVRRLQAVAPGDPVLAPEERVFNWSQSWDTREAFYEAFGRRSGGHVLDLMLSRGWLFVEIVPENQDAGAIGRTYTAQNEETPQAIARRYDALARERWATELKAANPERDWTARIYAGDTIAIPEVWAQPFWGAAKERGYLDASGPTGTLAVGNADPFRDLSPDQTRQRFFRAGRSS
jgi:hypothetical protein